MMFVTEYWPAQNSDSVSWSTTKDYNLVLHAYLIGLDGKLDACDAYQLQDGFISPWS